MNWPMKVVPAVWAGVLFRVFQPGRIHDQVHRPCKQGALWRRECPGLAKLHQGCIEFQGWVAQGEREPGSQPLSRDLLVSAPRPWA